ncbi:MAG: phosphotransferase family protein [Pseudomonadales bacterium]
MAKHKVSDFADIQSKLSDWFVAKLPERKNLVVEDFNFPENTGESNVTLIVKVNWTAGAGRGFGRFVVRILPEGEKVFNDYDLALQYHMMEAMAANDIPVPPLLALEEDSSIIGGPFYVMNFVDGQIPSDNPPMHMVGWLTEVTEEQRASIWWSGLENMAKIHRLDLDSVTLPDLSRPDRGASYIEQQVKMYEDMTVGRVAEVCNPVILDALKWCRDNMPADENIRLCWGDARPANQIYRDYKSVAVLDWEMACLCNPLLDATWWYWMDYCLSTSLGIPRLPGFGDREETLQRWQELTGYSLDNVAWYELFALVRYTIIMERVFNRMESQGEERMDNLWVPTLTELYEKAQAAITAEQG